MPQTMQEKVIDLVGYANAAIDKAAAERGARQVLQSECDTLAKEAASALINNERILEEDRANFVKAASDPREVLKLLTKLAEHRNKDELGTLGSPLAKSASATGGIVKAAEDPNVGIRRAQPTEADAALFAGLGLQQPTTGY